MAGRQIVAASRKEEVHHQGFRLRGSTARRGGGGGKGYEASHFDLQRFPTRAEGEAQVKLTFMRHVMTGDHSGQRLSSTAAWGRAVSDDRCLSAGIAVPALLLWIYK